jgi:tRNA nucleotidyltransferase (CCA-adding enzyme)
MAPMLDPGRVDLLEALGALPTGRLLLRALPADLEPAVHLVGGATRDLLLGGAPTDLDLVAEGPAAPVASALGGSVRSHDRFGTVTVTLDGSSFDVASARRERYPYPGALPEVQPAPLDDDLRRRDFTVNAVALALTGPERGQLRSVPEALADIEHGLLRVLHARSFEDDPTRLLRMARYSARLHFEIEPLTLGLATDAVRDRALATVSGPRIGNELRATAREPDAISAFETLHQLEIDGSIAEAFGLGPREAGTARAALELLPADGRIDVLTVAIAGRALGPARFGQLLDRLAFEAPMRDAILGVASRCEQLSAQLRHAARPSEIGAAVNGGTVELVALAGALGARDPARLWIERLRFVAAAIDGGDLIAAGIPEGPAVGIGLRAALAAALDGEATDRDDQLQAALRAARDSG